MSLLHHALRYRRRLCLECVFQCATTGPSSIVIGSLTGTGTKRLMLMGHMDTVYPTGILATQPYKVRGNRLYSPGIADDKSSIAVILHGLQQH